MWICGSSVIMYVVIAKLSPEAIICITIIIISVTWAVSFATNVLAKYLHVTSYIAFIANSYCSILMTTEPLDT